VNFCHLSAICPTFLEVTAQGYGRGDRTMALAYGGTLANIPSHPAGRSEGDL